MKFQKLFKGKTNSTLLQLFRYLFVGGAAFIVDYGSLFLLTEVCGVEYLYSAAIAFILGLIVNYLISISWVFNDRKMLSRWKEFVTFATIGLIGLLFNEIIMYIGSNILNLHYMLSKLCSTIIVFFWNFFARKIILYSPK